VTDVVFAQEKGENPADAGSIIRDAVDAVVLKQVATGVDIVSDGEMSKISYATYIKDRITGFDGDSERDPPSDLEEFPGFLKRQASSGGTPTYRRPCCIGAIEVKDMGPAEVDIQNLLSATQKHSPTQSFMNAASPGVIALFQPNKHYPNHEAYLEALADAMAYEYRAIVDAGIVLQLDSPDLGLGRHMLFKDKTDEEYHALACVLTCRGAQPRAGRYPEGDGSPACVLGKLRRTTSSRCAHGNGFACCTQGQRGRFVVRIVEPKARARVGDFCQYGLARRPDSGARRYRLHHEFCRTPEACR